MHTINRFLKSFGSVFLNGKLILSPLIFLLQSGCDLKLKSYGPVGEWRLGKLVIISSKLDESYNSTFRLTLNNNGTFKAKDIPPGILFNNSDQNSETWGKWAIEESGISLRMHDGGHFGGFIEIRDGRMCFTAEPSEFIYFYHFK